MSTSTYVAFVVMMIIALAVTYLNYQHASKCVTGSGEGSDKDSKLFMEALSRRLLEAESQNLHNSILLDKIIDRLRHKVFQMEELDLQEIRTASKTEAVRMALRLSEQPLPRMPEYSLKTNVEGDAEALADLVDDILSRVSEQQEEQEGAEGDAGMDLDANNAYGAELEGGFGGGKREGGGAGGEDDLAGLSDAETEAMCKKLQQKHGVVVGVSWGSLPFELQEKWVVLSCDYHLGQGAGEVI